MADAPKIVLGVTGSIAAYKALELLRLLQKCGADVWPVLTACAAQYVGPLSFRALSGHPVPVGDFASMDPGTYAHLGLSENAAAMVVAPASANTIAKLAGGFASDVLSAAALSLPATVPLFVAPAMNVRMWRHPAVAENVVRLRARGVRIVEPGTGRLACGDVGQGRLADLPLILDALSDVLPPAP